MLTLVPPGNREELMPAKQDSGAWPPWRTKLKSIDDPIAEESFTYRTPKGENVTSRVVIGRPRRVPRGHGDAWYCPLLIEGETVGIMPVLSLGPVGAIVNAGSVVRQFLEEKVFYPKSRKVRPRRKLVSGSRAERKSKPKAKGGRKGS